MLFLIVLYKLYNDDNNDDDDDDDDDNYNNNNLQQYNTLIILSPYGSFKISAQMIDYDCHEYFDLFNDNMWSTSLLFSLLNSENHEHLKNSRNADLS